MARWMILYRDENSDPKCAIVDDTTNGTLPFGSEARSAITNLDGYNDGGGAFIVELPDEGEPTVYDMDSDNEVGRDFTTL